MEEISGVEIGGVISFAGVVVFFIYGFSKDQATDENSVALQILGVLAVVLFVGGIIFAAITSFF